MEFEAMVNAHYGNDEIFERVVAALANAGIDPAHPTIEELAPIDHFHGGGLNASKILAEKTEIRSGMHVLDAGCGVGGPARFLASAYGCTVVGVDLSERFIAAARRLNELLGLANQVEFRVANVADTGLSGGTFDVAWSQNVFMNVEDKEAAFREILRVLKPGGTFLLQVTTGQPGGWNYPVPWASGPDMDFVSPAPDVRRDVLEAGFEIVDWDESALAPSAGGQQVTPGINPAAIMDLADFDAARANSDAANKSGHNHRVIAVLKKQS